LSYHPVDETDEWPECFHAGAGVHRCLKVSILDAWDIPDCWEMINHYCEAFAEYAERLRTTEEREASAARFREHEHSLR
jgi:hypothetical protein